MFNDVEHIFNVGEYIDIVGVYRLRRMSRMIGCGAMANCVGRPIFQAHLFHRL